MLAGAAHAAPASIPKPLVITGPPSVPVEGGPEKLLSECNYLGIHLSEGQDDVLISCDSGLLILALLILVLTLVVLFLTLALVLNLLQLHKQVTLVRRG